MLDQLEMPRNFRQVSFWRQLAMNRIVARTIPGSFLSIIGFRFFVQHLQNQRTMIGGSFHELKDSPIAKHKLRQWECDKMVWSWFGVNESPMEKNVNKSVSLEK